jgi:hypothetical protein
MLTKLLSKPRAKPDATVKRVANSAALPTVEAAQLRLNTSKGLFASAPAKVADAFMEYDGPIFSGPKRYKR